MSFLTDAEIVTNALNAYYQESVSAQKPVIHQESLANIIADLDLAAYIRDGGLSGEQLATFLQKYLAVTTRLHHPAYMAHQVAVPHYAGALGSLIDGFTNNAMAIYEMGPGAASIEYFLINWLLTKVGWQPAPLNLHAHSQQQPYGGGVLTHGGSLANLTALVAARNALVPDVWKLGIPGDLALLAPAGSHYSIARAAGILGIGQQAIYHVDVDQSGAIIPDRLSFVYERLKNDGKRAVAVIANACSTAVGIYDPLQEIGEFCQANKLWLHVDGAHGASALLSAKYRFRLKGVEQADSFTWDAHKLLQTPTLCAALLVRDHTSLDTAFEQEASYLFHAKEQPGFDFIHRTIECTKAGLGLKLFLVVAAVGEKGLAEYLERQCELTLKAYDYICQQSDFECAVRPQSNILCFRIAGSDDAQLKIRDQLNAQGRFYLSTTAFNGVRYLRIVLMNPHTGFEEIQQLIQQISKLYGEIQEEKESKG
jgi:L-2,4-diaminobutyrate decarboxylase